MNLNQLVTFSVVAECGQISRAAEELFIAQPALSRQIKALEEELGVPLFERHRGGRQLSLTYAGEILLNHVRVLLGEVAETKRRMDEVKRGAAGLVRIAAGPVILRYIVTPAVSIFRRNWPDTELRVNEAEYESVFSLVEEGTADLAVGIVLPEMHTLQWEELYNARLYALVSPEHRLAERPFLDAEELAREELLLLKTGRSARLTHELVFHLNRLLSTSVFETSIPETALTFAEQGLGLAVLTDTVPIEGFRVCPIPIHHDGSQVQTTGVVAWHRRRELPEAARAFIAALKEQSSLRPTGHYQRVGATASP